MFLRTMTIATMNRFTRFVPLRVASAQVIDVVFRIIDNRNAR